MKHFYINFFYSFIFILCNSLSAQDIDVNKKGEVYILKNSYIYFDTKDLNLTQIRTKHLFKPYNKDYINVSMRNVDIWIRFKLINSSNHKVKKMLILTSPLLENISFYKQSNLNTVLYRGVNYLKKEHHTLVPYYNITIPAHSFETYYLKVNSNWTPIDFRLKLDSHKHFKYRDRVQQFIDILLIGFVLALMLYSFLLYFYIKDKSYLFYSFYLFALIYQQFTYLGLTQIYFPKEFIHFDMQIPVFKVNLLVITASLFAMNFLKTKSLRVIDNIYKFFIIISIAEIVLLSSSYFYNLYIVIFSGFLFIVFNLIAGIISYRQGNKQARLFIVGFSIVFLSYFLIILDAIGVTSIIQKYQNILMFGTAFEALILSLAFADRYLILQKEKDYADKLVLKESKTRTAIIEREVVKKTEELNSALEAKELLLKEVHHRVKNNLQIILSIIRLQQDDITDELISKKFIDLENRINAISKSYNMLLLKDNIEEIDMSEYIESLLLDIKDTMQKDGQNIKIKTDINAIIPLRESVYIGLIVNELVTNSYKYAFDKEGTISISLKTNRNSYELKIEDNGKGYNSDEIEDSLGLKLIEALVQYQLNGTISRDTKNHTVYIIRFDI